MIIGVPKEIKNKESRVALTPAGAVSLIERGHKVLIESNAGLESGFPNNEYLTVGCKICAEKKDVWAAHMVLKVKEPLSEEFKFFREGLILFTFLHLAPAVELTNALLKSKVISIAYESVEHDDGSLPLLQPMSEVAGRMATQIGAQYLEKTHGGKGILLGGVPGVKKGKVTIIGGGTAGTSAAKIAVGLGAQVTILDVSSKRLVELDNIFGNSVQTEYSNSYTIHKNIVESDLAIGAVLISGHKAPILVSERSISMMKPGSVVVDIAIDQGGIFETIDRVTTHDEPTFLKHDIVHYAVSNIPGAVPNTSTLALTNCTLPYILELANKGFKGAIVDNDDLYGAVNTYNGKLTIRSVAYDQNKSFTELKNEM